MANTKCNTALKLVDKYDGLQGSTCQCHHLHSENGRPHTHTQTSRSPVHTPSTSSFQSNNLSAYGVAGVKMYAMWNKFKGHRDSQSNLKGVYIKREVIRRVWFSLSLIKLATSDAYTNLWDFWGVAQYLPAVVRNRFKHYTHPHNLSVYMRSVFQRLFHGTFAYAVTSSVFKICQ